MECQGRKYGSACQREIGWKANTGVPVGALGDGEGVCIDENGARYFKRLRCHNTLVVLESLNPDGLTVAEVLSIDNSHALPKITGALEVIGVLFELPNAKKAIPSS